MQCQWKKLEKTTPTILNTQNHKTTYSVLETRRRNVQIRISPSLYKGAVIKGLTVLILILPRDMLF